MTLAHQRAVGPPNIKSLTLRQNANCGCGTRMPAGTIAGWDRTSLVVRCRDCVAEAELAVHDLLLHDEDDPALIEHREHEHELRFRARLSPFRDDLHLLHDRRILRSRSRIDHLIVAPSGIFVVMVKAYAARPVEQVRSGGLFTPARTRLVVGARDKSHLITSLNRQVSAVNAALALDFRYEDAPVTALLCLTDALFPRMSSIDVEGVAVRNLPGTARILSAAGELDAFDRAGLARHLSRQLPPAHQP